MVVLQWSYIILTRRHTRLMPTAVSLHPAVAETHGANANQIAAARR
jgi:hypothetical protein